MVSAIKDWIRANPQHAKQIEQLSVTAVYVLSNPNSLLSMETGYALSSALSTVVNNVLTIEGDFNTDDKLQMFASLIGNLQQLAELCARKYTSVTKTWRIVSLIALVRALISLMLKRRTLSQLSNTLFKRSIDSKTQYVAPDTGYSRLSIPRVSLDTRAGSPKASPTDILELLLELFYSFRPLLWALLVWKMGGSKHNWRVWRTMTIAEVCAAILSSVNEKNRSPIVSTDIEDSASQSKVPARYGNLLYCLARDPFFSTSLKHVVEERIVNGFISKIPLLGMVISAQTQYALKMQSSSFLYTVGNFEL